MQKTLFAVQVFFVLIYILHLFQQMLPFSTRITQRHLYLAHVFRDNNFVLHLKCYLGTTAVLFR